MTKNSFVAEVTFKESKKSNQRNRNRCFVFRSRPYAKEAPRI